MAAFKNSTVKIDNEEKMCGEALYTDDIPLKDFLWVRPLRSNIPCGRIKSVNVPTLPKGYYFISASDIVKENVVNIIFSDWPVFADGYVKYYGETILNYAGQ